MIKIKALFSWFLKDKKRLAIPAVTIIALIVLVISRNNTSQTSYTTTKAEKGTIVSTITASGNIISSNINNITTQTSGTVKKVYVNDGDMVRRGQIIAEIDLDTQGFQNYLQALVTLQSAATSFNSANNNYRSAQATAEKVLDDVKGHSSDETFAQKATRTQAEVVRDNAYDSVKLAQLKLNSANLDFQTNTPVITAPVSGIIKSITIAEGMNLGTQESSSGSRANQRIATIGTQGLPIATFNVSEIDVSQIKTGQKTTVILDSLPDLTFTGKVVSVDRVGTTTNNVTTYPIIIKFDTTSEKILPKMAATAKIIIETKSDVLIVPSQTIINQSGQSTIKIIKNKQTQSVNVETGLTSDTQTEIISGISEGDEVVTATTTQTSGSQRSTSVFSSFGGGAFRSGGR